MRRKPYRPLPQARARGTRGVRAVRSLVATALMAVLLVVPGCSLSGLLGGASETPPAEQVARMMRLTGVTRYAVAEVGGIERCTVYVPTADSAAQVSAVWMAAVASLRTAYPSARGYAVEIVGPSDIPLVSLRWTKAAEARRADATQLRDSAEIEFPETVSEETDGAGISTQADFSAHYLDVVNQSEGAAPDACVEAYEAMVDAAPGYPAAAPGQSVAVLAARRVAAMLAEVDSESARELAGVALQVRPDAQPASAVQWRYLAAAAEAVTAGGAEQERYLEAVSALAATIADPEDADPRMSDAVAVAARAEDAPAAMKLVSAFTRAPELDSSATDTSGDLLPVRAIAVLGIADDAEPAITWESGVADASEWLAYRRADGRIYWRAGETGPAALTDGSIDGIVYDIDAAVLVDANDVGAVLTTIELK